MLFNIFWPTVQWTIGINMSSKHVCTHSNLLTKIIIGSSELPDNSIVLQVLNEFIIWEFLWYIVMAFHIF